MTTFKNPVFRYIFPWEVIKYIISLQMKSLLIISPQSYHNWFCTMVWHKDENTRIFELLLHLILSDIWRNIKETSLWLNWMHSCRKTRCDQTDVKKSLHKFNTLMLHISCKKSTSFNDNYPHISVYLASMQQGQYTAQHWHLSKFINFCQTILAKSLLSPVKIWWPKKMVSDLRYFAPVLHIS